MVGRVYTALSGQHPSGSCAYPITESAGTLAKIPCNLRDFFFLCSEMGRTMDQRCHGAQTSGAWYILSRSGKKGLRYFQEARSQHRLVLCTAI